MAEASIGDQKPGYSTITIDSVSFNGSGFELTSEETENYSPGFEDVPVIPSTVQNKIDDGSAEVLVIGIHSVDAGPFGVGSGEVGDPTPLIGLKVLEPGTSTDVPIPIFPVAGKTDIRPRPGAEFGGPQVFPPPLDPEIQGALYTSDIFQDPMPEPVATTDKVSVENGLDQNEKRGPLRPTGGTLKESQLVAVELTNPDENNRAVEIFELIIDDTTVLSIMVPPPEIENEEGIPIPPGETIPFPPVPVAADKNDVQIIVLSGDGTNIEKTKPIPDDGEITVVVQPPEPAERTKLTAGEQRRRGDSFGDAVALDDGTALIGAPLNSDLTKSNEATSAAYVFTQLGGSWKRQARFTTPDVTDSNERPELDGFGKAVALDGDTALVGAPFDFQEETQTGAVFVFTRSGGNWGQQTILTDKQGNPGDQFGSSVALDGDTALVGATRTAAVVFTRSGGTWTQQDRLTVSGSEFLGVDVALDGDTALIGSFSGAYVFTRSNGVWDKQLKFTDSGSFGGRVALNGDTALVGEPFSSARPGVFTRSGGSWSESPQDQLSVPDFPAGEGIALADDTALVGASSSERAFEFTRSDKNWTQTSRQLAPNDSDKVVDDDEFGFSTALSEDGSTALIGAPGDNISSSEGNDGGSAGAAYVFQL